MKLITWNINGLRSMKQSVQEILNDFASDIICFQETKISRNLLPENSALVPDYSSYFSFPKRQSGYSGVATYCSSSCTPVNAVEGITNFLTTEEQCARVSNLVKSEDLPGLDSEGRTVVTHHEIRYDGKTEMLAVINVYCPCVDPEKPERHIYKMQFCHILEAKARSLQKCGWHVIILGDINISHCPIDHCDPGDEREFNSSEARQWLTSFLQAKDSVVNEPSFVDAYRYLHPGKKEAYTCWNTLTGARKTNYGTRIDYVFISSSLLPLLLSCEILASVEGSDHCPVSASINCNILPASSLPALCTRHWLEFSGKQQKLLNFLQKSGSADSMNQPVNDLKRKSPLKTSALKRQKPQNKQKAITNFFRCGEVSDKRITNELDLQVVPNGYSRCLGKNVADEIPEQEVPSSLSQETEAIRTKQTLMWKSVLCGPPKPPLCPGHWKPCVLRTVRKDGSNFGRQFFACSQPNGLVSNPESRCNFFQWVTAAKKDLLQNA